MTSCAPSVRLAKARTMLSRPGGSTKCQIADALGVSSRTALRLIRAVEEAGDEVMREEDQEHPSRLRYSIPPSSAHALVADVRRALGLSTSAELVAVLQAFIGSTSVEERSVA